VKYLLDTHLLIWALCEPERLSSKVRDIVLDDRNDLYFSAASLWELTIKQAQARLDFLVAPHILYQTLISKGYIELPVSSLHTLAVGALSPIHKDPFDRILIAQAQVEGITLLTCDERMAQYGGMVLKV
jgi:PIN domain nuclease of toxin-antitoxin system